ncbi:right-handed parallel beta-helix repeat-containing protein [Nocardioides sp. KIGAM211]|uniref:Right-handed parallel beta-helix repeat-containing protein n=1 Tax=Nocardioides luti TaxID=2761101 RepID=A0A7X0RJ32_9ACTN|nr:right-handed parallel beta-helix repeat-containing protein [Nocardioides luti]MBB6629226.1 right-handed parallel beta-helix repeat-containing protein [Nocardioides luti]
MPRLRRALLALVVVPGLVATGLAAGSTAASAHEERPAQFPDGTGHRPSFLGYDNPRARVVCKPSSASRIAAMPEGKLKTRNERLLKQCDFRSIQTAINSIRKPRTSVYVLPGVYTEARWAHRKRSQYCSHLETSSKSPLEASEYIGSLSSPDTGAKEDSGGTSNPIALSYADQRACPHNLNLIAVFGDRTPKNKSISCDSKFCGLQVVGTGRSKTDVIVNNRFSKLNGIRADRAGGLYLKNITFEQAEFNSVYILETDGFVVDHVMARGNDEYGILAFASDHGLIQRSEAYYNGDSGFYPGSGSDLNADNPNLEATRYAIEIRFNKSHHNTLGYSGTAGNSIWAHDNKFYKNATGIATDSLFPGHPGLPQDHARWNRNEIYSNNSNWYTRFVDTGVCAKPMKQRGYINGTVCPVVPTPVGTGVLIAGGNFDRTDHNWIYDNWRFGTMQFWVPAALRDEYDPALQNDTSHHNHTTDNQMGFTKSGEIEHNGSDHWWDEQGNGNCWENNTYSRGVQTDNFTVDPPSCADGGSVFTPGAPVKDAGFLSCSQYDRDDPNFSHPEGCNWFDSPTKPDASGSTTGAPEASEQDSGFLVAAPVMTAVSALLVALGLRRRRQSHAA